MINKFKRGYQMYDCTIEEFQSYERLCYDRKESLLYETKWNFVTFESLDQALKMIRMTFVPFEHGSLGKHEWKLDPQKQLLILNLQFENGEKSDLYQCAIERAWALGGHLDPRVKQIYYE